MTISDKPTAIELDTTNWWVKVLAMLQHNWALIATNDKGGITVYFFHDGGTTKNSIPYNYKAVKGMIAIVDSLDFESLDQAETALGNNSYKQLKNYPGPWNGSEPKGIVFDARDFEPSIFSKQNYWIASK